MRHWQQENKNLRNFFDKRVSEENISQLEVVFKLLLRLRDSILGNVIGWTRQFFRFRFKHFETLRSNFLLSEKKFSDRPRPETDPSPLSLDERAECTRPFRSSSTSQSQRRRQRGVGAVSRNRSRLNKNPIWRENVWTRGVDFWKVCSTLQTTSN